MDYINARVRTDHLDHIEEVKESDTLIDSDDEAVRHIFDRARQADFLEREIDQLRREIDFLEEEYEDEVRKAGTRSSDSVPHKAG